VTLEQIRCEKCNKVLMETNHAPGSVIRMKCPRCEAWNTLRVTPPVERPGGYEKRAVG
jgi:phage FluMu protein Com